MTDGETGAGSELERRLGNARSQIQQLEKELELTSRGVTALTLDLERSQERFRMLVESVGAAFRLTSAGADQLLYVSPGFELVWGLSREGLPGDPKTLLRTVHPDDLEQAEQQLLRPDLGNPSMKFRIEHPDLGLRWVRDRVYPVRNGDGSLTGLAAITQDVTSEERAEQRLRKSEARHRSLFQEHPDAVFALDLDARITTANDQCVELTGQSPDVLLDQLIFEFFPGEDRRIREQLSDTVRDRSPRSFETHFMVDKEDDREVEVTTLPIMFAGDVTGIFAIVKDVTEEKKLERQFLQSQKMEAVGRMAGGVVHDFNNILTSIGGHVRLILDEADEAAPLHDDLEEVLRAADRATKLTRQLLTFSRHPVARPDPVILDRVVGEMQDMIERVVGDQIKVRSALSAPETKIEIDDGRLQQVLMNLVVNARDAMSEGGRLTIATDVLDLESATVPRARGGHLTPGRYVVLRVSDTGSGMDPEVQRKVFDPFFTTKDPDRGTGLGLSTVYGIVEQSGGDVSLDSEPGIGTVFKLYFPATERAIVEQGKDLAPKTEARTYAGSETVLLAEDDPSVRAVTGRILERHGYVVIEAATGADALQQMKENPGEIDLILTDVRLPDLSGPEVVDRMMKLETDIAVVFMSGYTSEVMADWSRSGVDFSFVEKPFTPDDLLRTVRSRLGFSAEGGTSQAG